MDILEIKKLIEVALPQAEVQVGGEGCNARVLVVSSEFEGKSLLAQQRLVYKALGDKITTGEIHALSIKSFTPAQWEALPSKEGLV